MKREYLIQKQIIIIYILTFIFMLVFSLSMLLFDFNVSATNRTPANLVTLNSILLLGFLFFTIALPGLSLTADNKMFYVNVEGGRANQLVIKWSAMIIGLVFGLILYYLLIVFQLFVFDEIIHSSNFAGDFVLARAPIAVTIPIVFAAGKLMFTHSIIRQFYSKTISSITGLIGIAYVLFASIIFLAYLVDQDDMFADLYRNVNIISISVIIMSFALDYYLLKHGDVK